MTQQSRPAEREVRVTAPGVTNHNEYECPGCNGPGAEEQIAREVYACSAGRHCTEATPEQRIAYGQQIAVAVAALRRASEAS